MFFKKDRFKRNGMVDSNGICLNQDEHENVKSWIEKLDDMGVFIDNVIAIRKAKKTYEDISKKYIVRLSGNSTVTTYCDDKLKYTFYIELLDKDIYKRFINTDYLNDVIGTLSACMQYTYTGMAKDVKLLHLACQENMLVSEYKKITDEQTLRDLALIELTHYNLFQKEVEFIG